MSQPQILKKLKESSDDLCHLQGNTFVNLNKMDDFHFYRMKPYI